MEGSRELLEKKTQKKSEATERKEDDDSIVQWKIHKTTREISN